MGASDYVISAVILISNTSVWIIQQQRIKAFKEKLDLIDMDEIMKHISLKVENIQLENRKKNQQLEEDNKLLINKANIIIDNYSLVIKKIEHIYSCINSLIEKNK